MPVHTADSSLNKTARMAGALFLFTFLGPLFYGAFVFPKLTAAGDAAATVGSIMANELLFRLAVLNELICSVGAIALALVLYVLLKTVHRTLSLLAVFLKMTEAVLLAVIALAHFIALLILKGQTALTGIEPGQVQALVGLFINQYFYVGGFTMVFHGLNAMVFLYLFLKSKYIPAMPEGFGIFSYALIFLYGGITILAPHYASKLAIQVVCMTPSVLTELIMGFWLLIKGINFQQKVNPEIESA